MRPAIARLRASSWTELAGLAFAVFCMSALFLQLLPASIKPAACPLPLVAALLLLAAKDLAHAPDAWRRLRAAHAERAPWGAYLAALLPPELVGMAKLDRQLWIGCACRLLRRPRPALPAGTPLGYLERGAYGTALAVVYVSVLIELPLNAAMLHLFVEDPDTLLVLHIAGAVAVLYTLAWALGDCWHIGAGHHVLTQDALMLRVGARASGVLPLDAIERMEAVDQPVPMWRRKRGVKSGDTLLVTPFDKPNCVLVLKVGADLSILHWQVRKRLPTYVFLYLDRPGLLAARLPRS